MAIGATPGEVRRLALRSGVRLGAIGVVAGLALALASGGVIRTLLYDTSTTDPATVVVVGAVLLGAALLASWIPARRATSVSPAEVLRGD